MQQAQPIVRGFAGENRLLADDSLPDNIAVDGLNNDYSAATIRRRLGRKRLHTDAILPGGVRVTNSSQAKCIWIPYHTSMDPSGDWSFEFSFILHSLPTSNTILIGHTNGNPGAAGWWFWYVAGLSWTFGYRDGAASADNTNLFFSSLAPQVGKKFHWAVSKSSGTITAYVSDGTTTISQTNAVTGHTASTAPLLIGAAGTTPTSTTLDVTFDEVRMWSDARTADEFTAGRFRELTDDEVLDHTLVGYWKLNEGQWNTCKDSSLTRNHGTFDDAGPSFERSILPQDASDGFCARFDGVDDYGAAPYHTAYAPIISTGNTWTVEGWFRLDAPTELYGISYEGYLLQLGDYTGGNGAVLSITTNNGVDRRLVIKYSTTTTHTNATIDPSVELPVGIPFHLAVVRNSSTIAVYLNGESVYSATSATTENGPGSGTTYGMTFGAKNAGGTYSLFAPVSIDDVRVWKTARSQTQIQNYMNRTLADVADTNLIGYWRFDASDKEKDETARANIVFKADGTAPKWGQGLVYPVTAPKMLLCAPLTRATTGNDTRARSAQFSREILLATQTGFWSLIGNSPRHLREMYTPGEPTLFDWCHFRDKLIFCNGIEANQKYDGKEIPRAVSLAQPSAAPSAATGGAGNLSGNYYYRVSFRNSRDGTESLASVASTVVAPSSEEVDLSSIPVSSDPQVNQRRLYRLDPGASVYRYLADIDDNTTTTYTDDDADISTNAAIDDYRGHAEPARYCAVYGNRLFFANTQTYPSSLIYSEANDESAFTAVNLIHVDRGDGDEITGIRAAFGGLVIFKQRSIHFLIGDGPDSYDLSRIVAGQGCVSGHTIAASARGLYYLWYDGAYLLSGVGAAQPISISQQPIFDAMDADLYRYAVGVYDAVRHIYKVTFDIAEQENSYYYAVRPDWFTNYWRFNGNAVDSAEDTDMTASGSPDYVNDAAFGQVVSLDGSNDYFSAAYSTYPTSGLSFGMWFRPSENVTTGERTLAQISDGSGNNAMYLTQWEYNAVWGYGGMGRAQPVGKTVKYSLQRNNWYHLVLVREGRIEKLYINGVVADIRVATGDATSFTPSGTGTFEIGSGDVTSLKAYGKLCNVWFSEKVLEQSQVREIYEYESAFGYKNKSRISMVYDEETQSWAKWDSEPDCLVNAAHSSNRVEIISAEDGFAFRLLDGYQDGSDYVDGGNVTRVGAIVAGSGNFISDSTYQFSTKGNGIAGTPFTITDITTGIEQKCTIVANTATGFYLNKSLDLVTGTWLIGAIDWYWESRWMDMGDPFVVKRLYRLLMWLKETDFGGTVKFKGDFGTAVSDYDESWQTGSFSSADEFERIVTNSRGRKFKVRFERKTSLDGEIDIHAFQFAFAARKDV